MGGGDDGCYEKWEGEREKVVVMVGNVRSRKGKEDGGGGGWNEKWKWLHE